MSSDDLATRIRAASRSCPAAVSGPVFRSPSQAFEDLARTCAELGIDEWDTYGESGPVERLESELRELFGVQAAAFFPSGVMAQQAALRVHADRAGTRKVALPDLSHLLVHEEDGPRLLHGLEISLLTRGFETPAARHVEAIPGHLGAVLVELPLRDAGCLLPSWDDLNGLSQACRDRGVALHFDGARIWESQPWFGRSLSEIAALADSLYVSFYKGLGGLAGAALLGPADFIAEAKLWRRRHGGTIYRLTAEAVSALAGLRDRLPVIPEHGRVGSRVRGETAVVHRGAAGCAAHQPVPRVRRGRCQRGQRAGPRDSRGAPHRPPRLAPGAGAGPDHHRVRGHRRGARARSRRDGGARRRGSGVRYRRSLSSVS